nr:adenylate/guanylate cyclase domain-containing protein [Mesorhizobium ciceri]
MASSVPAKPAAPAARQPGPDARKTVTILFADIVDSSRLSLSLDPEALRNLLSRYFGELSAVVQRHGGIVNNYIGDAIMAVFGMPFVHEDDALRAVRAAVEMRETLAILNHELEASWGRPPYEPNRHQHRRGDRGRPNAGIFVSRRRGRHCREAP